MHPAGNALYKFTYFLLTMSSVTRESDRGFLTNPGPTRATEEYTLHCMLSVTAYNTLHTDTHSLFQIHSVNAGLTTIFKVTLSLSADPKSVFAAQSS